jgi:hypothetical protein
VISTYFQAGYLFIQTSTSQNHSRGAHDCTARQFKTNDYFVTSL